MLRTRNEGNLAEAEKENGRRRGARLERNLVQGTDQGWSRLAPLRWATTLRAFS